MKGAREGRAISPALLGCGCLSIADSGYDQGLAAIHTQRPGERTRSKLSTTVLVVRRGCTGTIISFIQRLRHRMLITNAGSCPGEQSSFITGSTLFPVRGRTRNFDLVCSVCTEEIAQRLARGGSMVISSRGPYRWPGRSALHGPPPQRTQETVELAIVISVCRCRGRVSN